MLTGFVLAAGFGTRLKPVTEHIPKAMVPLCGKPLLQHALEFYHKNGIESIGVNSYHFHEQLESFMLHSPVSFNLFHETGKIRGTGGALYFARNFLSQTPVFVVSNVDIIADVNLKELYDRFLSLNCIAGLAAAPAENNGSIYYDASTKDFMGVGSDIGMTGKSADFTGMAFYKKEFLDLLGEDDFSIIDVWIRSVEMGHSIKVIETGDIYWKDVGTPSALAKAHFDVIGNKLQLSIPSDMVVDKENEKACPKSFSEKELSKLGRDVWCEAIKIPRDVFIDNCVVFADAVFPEKQVINNALVTRWGEVAF